LLNKPIASSVVAFVERDVVIVVVAGVVDIAVAGTDDASVAFQPVDAVRWNARVPRRIPASPGAPSGPVQPDRSWRISTASA
jgi:hypothetical protein